MAVDEAVQIIMAGGDGPNSYRHNSSHQRALLEGVKERINKAILTNLDLEKLNISASNTCKIGDFGCSVGPNTFVAVNNLIDAVLDLSRRMGRDENNLQFQVFFNDQSNNDFNTLFRTLPKPLRYFPAGIPGSFFDQVLPTRSLHLAHCSNSLTVLSQLPKDILDRESNAWNGGSIYCAGNVKAVRDAYYKQFEIDMETFLNARAKEMVSGGLMLLLGTLPPDGVIMSNTFLGKLLEIAGACLHDFAASGKISKEEVETFNLPFYPANISELKELIERNGCYRIEVMEIVGNDSLPFDPDVLAAMFRASLGEAIADRFGTEFTDGCFMESYKQNISLKIQQFTELKSHIQFFIMLRLN